LIAVLRVKLAEGESKGPLELSFLPQQR
jgi:hypothetical protein